MNPKIPTAALMGMAVWLAPEVQRNVQDLNIAHSQSARTEEFNFVNVAGSSFSQIDPSAMEEVNVVESKIVSSDKTGLETAFNDLADKWKNETRNQSAISVIVMHPSYLEIMGMGPAAIPLILRDLQKENNHWFTALRALTKTSPIKSEDAGNMKKMRKAWLDWGKEHGFLS